jgi:hypothetical protein
MKKFAEIPIHREGNIIHIATVIDNNPHTIEELNRTFPNCYAQSARETIPLKFLTMVNIYKRKWI